MKDKGNMKKRVFILVSFLIMVVIPLLLINLYQVEVESASVIGIFLGTLLLWISVDIGWPSLLGIGLLGLLPSVGYSKVISLSIGNTTFAFLMFTFMFTYALVQTPIIEFVAIKMITSRFSRRSPWHFVLTFILSVYFIGLFISPSVLFMVVLPIFDRLIKIFHLEKGHKTVEFLALALIVSLGLSTGATPISHVFSVMAMSAFQTITSGTISYIDYMMVGIPTTLIILALFIVISKYIYKPNLTMIKEIDAHQLKEETLLMTKKDYIIGFVFILTILLWILPDLLKGFLPEFSKLLSSYGLVFPPLLAVILLSIIEIDKKPLLNIQEAMSKGVHWPSLMLAASTLALGSVLTMEKIGIMKILENILVPLTANMGSYYLIIFFILWASIQTNLSSNLVTVSVVTPIAISILTTSQVNVNIGVVASLIGMVASFAFATPPAMPYIAITIGQRYATSQTIFKYGILMMVISVLVVSFIAYPLGNFIF